MQDFLKKRKILENDFCTKIFPQKSSILLKIANMSKKKGEKMEDRQKKVQKVIAERKKKIEKQKKNLTGMVMISIIVFVIIFILLYQKKNIDNRMVYYSKKYDTLQQALDEEKKHKKEIDKEAEYYKSDEYIAEIAREKLGLLKNNETVFSEEK